MDVTNVLAERGKRYGEFEDQAKYAQSIKELFRISGNWDKMEDDQREALDMIANKIGRILNGDPNYDDSWVDLAGYATLVANRLQRDQKRAKEESIEEYNRKAVQYLDEEISRTYPAPGAISTLVGGQVLGVHPKRTES